MKRNEEKLLRALNKSYMLWIDQEFITMNLGGAYEAVSEAIDYLQAEKVLRKTTEYKMLIPIKRKLKSAWIAAEKKEKLLAKKRDDATKMADESL